MVSLTLYRQCSCFCRSVRSAIEALLSPNRVDADERLGMAPVVPVSAVGGTKT